MKSICAAVRSFLFATMVCALSALTAYATPFTWSGTASSEVNNAANWGGTGPSNLPDLSENADWQLPDTLAGGANYNVNLTAGTGPWFVGGNSLGGITFLGGGSPTTPYTITGGDAGNILNLAGVIDYTSTTNRAIVANNSTLKQTFDVDILSWQSQFNAKNGDIELKAGRTLATGGGPNTISSNAIRNQLTTDFKGDKKIFLNSTVTATTSSTTNRGAIVYLGAETTPTADTMLVLGNIGTGFQAKVLITSANGGVVRATHNNSLGFTDTPTGGFAALVGTEIGLRSGFSNGTLELDGSAGDLTIAEFFRLGVRTQANGAAHIRNFAGSNTLTGGISLNYNSDPGGDSMFIDSAAGKLTLFGNKISQDRPNVNASLFFRGAGDIDLAGVNTIFPVAAGQNETQNIVKIGTGTVTTLAGTNIDYNGTTTIQEGAFILNGTHTSNTADATGTVFTPTPGMPYTVQAAGTLGGSGSTGQLVNLAGKLAPGAANSVGTLTVGGLNLTGGILDFQLNPTVHTPGSTFNDLLISTGAIDLTGGAILNVTSAGNLTAGDYDLIQFTGGLTGSAANITLGTIPLGAGLSASILVDADSVNLHIATGGGGLAGDFNNDGKVNGADYVTWRKGIAVPSTPAKYAEWRANFGAGGGSGLGANGAVPEPTCVALIAIAASLVGLRRKER